MGLINNQKAYDPYLVWHDGAESIEVHGHKIGYRFQIRMPNFRGNYLSCIEELRFTLDGENIDPSKTELLLNGKRFRLLELPGLFKEYWNVTDCGVVEVLHAGGLTGKHRIGALMRLRYGYSAYFGVCKVVTSKAERELDFTREGGALYDTRA